MLQRAAIACAPVQIEDVNPEQPTDLLCKKSVICISYKRIQWIIWQRCHISGNFRISGNFQKEGSFLYFFKNYNMTISTQYSIKHRNNV